MLFIDLLFNCCFMSQSRIFHTSTVTCSLILSWFWNHDRDTAQTGPTPTCFWTCVSKVRWHTQLSPSNRPWTLFLHWPIQSFSYTVQLFYIFQRPGCNFFILCLFDFFIFTFLLLFLKFVVMECDTFDKKKEFLWDCMETH